MTKPRLSIKRANRVAVHELKNKLRERGYDVGRSNRGIFNRAVVHAVVKFQNDNKLEPTGIVDDAVWTALDKKAHAKKKAPAKKAEATKKAPAKKTPAKKTPTKKTTAKKK